MKKHNVVLIILDTLREDFSEYIWKKIRDKGFIKYSAIAPSFWTIPSQISMITGTYPSIHGVHEKPKTETIDLKYNGKNDFIEELKQQKYRTYWFTANYFTSPYFGFPDTDFFYFPKNINSKLRLSLEEVEYLEDKYTKNIFEKILLMVIDKKIQLLYKVLLRYVLQQINKVTTKWPLDKGGNDLAQKLKQQKLNSPFFVYLNFMEVHEPYIHVKDGDLKKLRDPQTKLPAEIMFDIQKYRSITKILKQDYQKHAEYLEQLINDVLKKFPKDTLIIITSDHGQSLGENNTLYHKWGLYDELVKVPLFVKYPYCVKITKDKRPISLLKIKELVSKINKNIESDSFLYSDVVFSELFGYSFKYVAKNELAKKRLKYLKEKRIRATNKDSTIIFNIDKQKIEFKKGTNTEKLLNQIKSFLETISNLNNVF